MKKIHALVIAFTLMYIPVFAQQHACGTDELLQERFKNNPGLEEKFRQNNLEKARALQKKKLLKSTKHTATARTTTTTYEIPVIFHIIEETTRQPGDQGYVSRERIEKGLEILNSQLYYKTNPSSSKIGLGLKFVLAQSDEQLNYIPGIYRYESTHTQLDKELHQHTMIDEILDDPNNQAIRNGVNFDPEKYCNIYIIDNIIGNVAGYATLPEVNKSRYDGIVFEAKYIGNGENNTKVITHEVGHYLGLLHTFNGHEEGSCDSETDCLTSGDLICDTPVDYTNSGKCNDNSHCSGHVGATGNYMDYTGLECMDYFTPDQANWMLATLENERKIGTCDINRTLNPNFGCKSPCPNPVLVDFDVDIGDLENQSAGLDINFSNHTSYINNNDPLTGYSYTWKMGDGSTQTTSNVNDGITHNYSRGGEYNITLTAKKTNNDIACTRNITKTITTKCFLTPEFTINGDSPGFKKTISNGDVLTFQNQTTNTVSQEWYLDGTLISSSSQFSYTFTQNGIFQLELNVSNGLCWQTSKLYTIDVGNNCPGYTGLEASNWYFGNGVGITFKEGKLETLTSTLLSFEGVSSVSDPEGNFLFYTDGIHVYSKQNDSFEKMSPTNHELKGNSTNSAAQQTLIIPNPASNKSDSYFIFALEAQEDHNEHGETGLYYYEVDMSLNNGNGGLVAEHLDAPPIEKGSITERLSGFKSSTDDIIFIYIAVDGGIVRYTINESGLIASSRTFFQQENFQLNRDLSVVGCMKFSTDGSKLAVNKGKHIDFFDVNTSNGNLTYKNSFHSNPVAFYGVEFSPNQEYLYATGFGGVSGIYQIDINTLTATTLPTNGSYYGIQIAPDGKIYCCHYPNDKLSVIENPNAKPANLIFKEDVISLGARGALQLPQFLPNFHANKPTINAPECVLPGTKNIALSTDITPLPNETLTWSLLESGIYQTAEVTGLSGSNATLDVFDNVEGEANVRVDYKGPCGNTYSIQTVKISPYCSIQEGCPDVDIKLTAPERVNVGTSTNFQFELKSRNDLPINKLAIEPLNDFNTSFIVTKVKINDEEAPLPAFVDYPNMRPNPSGKIYKVNIEGYYETNSEKSYEQRFKIYSTDGCLNDETNIKTTIYLVKQNTDLSNVRWGFKHYSICDDELLKAKKYPFYLEGYNLKDVSGFNFSFEYQSNQMKPLTEADISISSLWNLSGIEIIEDNLGRVTVNGHAALNDLEKVDINYNTDTDGDLIINDELFEVNFSPLSHLPSFDCSVGPFYLYSVEFLSPDGSTIEEFEKTGSQYYHKVCGCIETAPLPDPSEPKLQTHFWAIRGNDVTYAGTTGWPSIYVNGDGEVVKTDATLGSPNGCTYELVSEITEGTANWQGELTPFGHMGEDMTSLGDLNGDGTIDFAVNAKNDYYPQDGNSDRFWILFMNENGTINHQVEVSRIHGGINDPLYQRPGNPLSNSELFGRSLDNIGDLDGNGVVDLIVGEPGWLQPRPVSYDPDRRVLQGRCWILFMNNNGTVKSHSQIINPNTAIENKYFGSSVTKIGDIDGDGITDVAIGDPWEDDGRTTVGAIYIYFMNSNGTYKSYRRLGSNDGGIGFLPNEGKFGSSLAEIGDFDRDGIPDLLIGSDPSDSPNFDTGSISILLLNSDGTVKNIIAYDLNDLAPLSSQGLGRNIYAYDVDKNGIKDLLYGTYSQYLSANDLTGRTYPFLNIAFLDNNGNVLSTERINSPSQTYDYFGESVEMYETPEEGQIMMVAATITKGVLYKIKTGGCSPCTNPTTFYYDADGDGFGVDNDTITLCNAPVGYATVAGDCDDTNADINPGIEGTCSDDTPTNKPLSKNVLTFNKNENDRVNIPHINAYDIGTGNFTVEAWVKYEGSQESYPAIFSNRSSGSSGFLMFTNSQGQLWVNMDGTNYGLSNTPTLYDGQCHHVAFTRSDTAMQWFIDGQVKRTSNVVNKDLSTTHDIWIGLDVSTSNTALNGSVKEVRFWNVGKDVQAINTRKEMLLNGNENGLIGYWKLDEESGQVALDLSNNANNGVLGGSSSTESNDPSRETNDCGVAALFSFNELEFTKSEKDKVTIPHLPEYNIGSGDFTIEAWVIYDGSQDTYPAIFSNRTSGSSGFLMYTNPQGRLWTNFDGTNYGLNSGASLYDNEYHHVAFTRDNGLMKWFVDGVLLKTQNASNKNISTNRDIWLGLDVSTSNTAINGIIKEVRFWNTGRSDSEITSYKDQELNGSENGLIGYWKLDEGEGQDAFDHSSLHNHGHLGSTYSVELDDPEWSTLTNTTPAVYKQSNYTIELNKEYKEVSNPIEVYPNPFNDKLTIEVHSKNVPVQIEIFNNKGISVYSTTIVEKGSLTPYWPAGPYILKAVFNGQVITRKIIKQ